MVLDSMLSSTLSSSCCLVNSLAANVRLLFFTPLFFASGSAWAGGTDWEFTVLSLADLGKGRYEITLKPVAVGSTFPVSCEVLVVSADYAFHWWDLAKPEDVTESGHYESIGFLKHAYARGDVVRFGAMGNGLGPSPGQPCKVRSRGLQLIENAAVYSYFKWP